MKYGDICCYYGIEYYTYTPLADGSWDWTRAYANNKQIFDRGNHKSTILDYLGNNFEKILSSLPHVDSCWEDFADGGSWSHRYEYRPEDGGYFLSSRGYGCTYLTYIGEKTTNQQDRITVKPVSPNKRKLIRS